MSGHIFISYSRADRAYVEELAAHLTYNDLQIWFDYEIAVGSRFDAEIQRKIDTCAAFVVILSPESVASEWVKREIGYADNRAKPMMPLMLRDCSIPIRLTSSHYEDVAGGRMPTRGFVIRLRRLVDIAPEYPDRDDTVEDSRALLGGVAPSVPRPRSNGDASGWPDPEPVRNRDGLMSTLHRTWMRAGSPPSGEVSTRTGAKLSETEVERLIGRYSLYMSLSNRNRYHLELLLGALGVPEPLMDKWRRSYDRVARRDRYSIRNLTRLVALGLPLLAIFALGGVAVWQFRGAHLGVGNWFAVAVSAAPVLGLAYASYEPFTYRASALTRTTIALYLLALGAGILLHGDVGPGITHAARIMAAWMAWRF